jgi:hypothetical protein
LRRPEMRYVLQGRIYDMAIDGEIHPVRMQGTDPNGWVGWDLRTGRDVRGIQPESLLRLHPED